MTEKRPTTMTQHINEIPKLLQSSYIKLNTKILQQNQINELYLVANRAEVKQEL